uniref:Uncharacterized protein n=1 Tax=Romanomermis culicivorax TaxID=13658 RepID=A0A915HWV4_ROMCU
MWMADQHIARGISVITSTGAVSETVMWLDYCNWQNVYLVRKFPSVRGNPRALFIYTLTVLARLEQQAATTMFIRAAYSMGGDGR